MPIGQDSGNHRLYTTSITAVVSAAYAPPVQPIKPSAVNKKELKKQFKKTAKKAPAQPSEFFLWLVTALYLLGIVYWSIAGIGLIVLGILALIGPISGLSLGMGIIFLLLGLAWLSIVFDLLPIFRKLSKLRNFPFGDKSLNIPPRLFNQTLGLAFWYLVLIFFTAMFPLGLVIINNFWLLILVAVLISTLQGRMKRKLQRNLNHLLEYVENPNNGKQQNINNTNFNQDLLDEGYR